jgi:nondiscriminating glutamyl-tRNA synthetase
MNYRVRFAPSPTGHLHVGNARTALFNWFLARKTGGVFILRIEDTDLARSEERFEEIIYEDLKWLGLSWEEGPDVDGPHGPYRQSDRIHIYRGKAEELVDLGRAYYCFCGEAELETQAAHAKEAGVNWKYPGTCRALTLEEVQQKVDENIPHVIRLKVRDGAIRFADRVHGEMEFSSEVISDLILIRSNGLPTYNYAVVVDDALMKISHVIRGDDHLSNTPKQVLIYEAFSWTPPEFAHLSTILGSDHTRLSKRHGATSIQHFQDMGILPEALVNYMALLGRAHEDGKTELLSPAELTQNFALERVSKSPAVFDMGKLFFVNRHYMKLAERERLLALSVPLLQRAGVVGEVTSEVRGWIGLVLDAELNTLNHLSELPERVEQTCRFDAAEALSQSEVREALANSGAGDVIRQLLVQLQIPGRDVVSDWKLILTTLKSVTGKKGKDLFHPVRVALTGRTAGRELDKLMAIFESGYRLSLPMPVKNCRQRVAEFVEAAGLEAA